MIKNWMKKVGKRREKQKKMFQFGIADSFPSDGLDVPNSSKWGMNKTEEYQEHFSTELPPDVSRNPLDAFRYLSTQKPIDHFITFNYFKKVMSRNADFMPLLKAIAYSTVLNSSVRHERVKEVVAKIKTQNIELGLDYHVMVTHGLRELIYTKKDALAVIKEVGSVGKGSADLMQPICAGLVINNQHETAWNMVQGYLKEWSEQKVQKVIYPIFEAYLKTDLEKCMKMVRKLQHYGFGLQPLMGHALLKELVQQEGDQEYVVEVVEMIKKLAELSPGMYRTLLGYYTRIDDVDKLAALEAEIVEQGLDLDSMKTRLDIIQMIEDGDISEADEKLKFVLKKAEYLIEYPVFDKLLEAVIEEGNASRQQPDQLENFTKMCGMASLYHMRNHELKLYHTDKTFLALLSLFAQNENAKRCLALVKKVNRRGMKATSEHYYHLVDAYCSRGSVLLTKAVIDDMYQNKIKPSTKIYNRWIKAYLDQTTPNFSKVFQIILQMPQIKVQIGDDTLQMVHDKLEENPIPVHTEKFLEVVRKVNARVSPLPYHLCMLAYLKQKKVDKVLEYYDLMASYCEPDAKSTEILMTTYISINNVDMATRVFEEAKVKPSVESCLLLLKMLSNKSDWKQIDVKFKEMKDMEIVDSKVLDAYLNILSKQDRIDEMISIATQYDFYPSIEILTKMHRQKDISEYLWRDAKVAKLVLGIPVLKVESDVLKTHNHFTKLFSEYKKVRLQSRKRCRSTDPITGP